MGDLTPVIDRYFAIWNETDQAQRRALIAQTWSDDASYKDPLLKGDGPDGIDAIVVAVHQQAPGHRFRQVGELDSHNDRVRFSWELIDTEAEPVMAGVDFGVIAEDGRLRSITGFFDYGPNLPAS